MNQPLEIAPDVAGENHQGFLLYGINAVKAGSEAQKAGLQRGDIILAVNSEIVGENKLLEEYVAEHLSGDTLLLKIKRGAEEMEKAVILDPSPQ